MQIASWDGGGGGGKNFVLLKMQLYLLVLVLKDLAEILLSRIESGLMLMADCRLPDGETSARNCFQLLRSKKRTSACNKGVQ